MLLFALSSLCVFFFVFSDLRIPLMWKDTEYFKNKGGTKTLNSHISLTFYFFETPFQRLIVLKGKKDMSGGILILSMSKTVSFQDSNSKAILADRQKKQQLKQSKICRSVSAAQTATK